MKNRPISYTVGYCVSWILFGSVLAILAVAPIFAAVPLAWAAFHLVF